MTTADLRNPRLFANGTEFEVTRIGSNRLERISMGAKDERMTRDEMYDTIEHLTVVMKFSGEDTAVTIKEATG